MFPSPNEFLADFHRLPVISWLNARHEQLGRGFVGWITDSPAVALPLVFLYLIGCLLLGIYATFPEWLSFQGTVPRTASHVTSSASSSPPVGEGAPKLAEKATRIEGDLPATHAGEGGAPTFADAVKEKPTGSA